MLQLLDVEFTLKRTSMIKRCVVSFNYFTSGRELAVYSPVPLGFRCFLFHCTVVLNCFLFHLGESSFVYLCWNVFWPGHVADCTYLILI